MSVKYRMKKEVKELILKIWLKVNWRKEKLKMKKNLTKIEDKIWYYDENGQSTIKEFFGDHFYMKPFYILQ